MVRVAGLKQQLASGVADTRADGLLPQRAARRHRRSAPTLMVAEPRPVWREELAAELCRPAHRTSSAPSDLNPEQRAAARSHFATQVFPALTPLAVDPGHPFPHLRNKSLNIAVALQPQSSAGSGGGDAARQLARGGAGAERAGAPGAAADRAGPARLRRCSRRLIAAHVGDLFPGYQVQAHRRRSA